MAGAYRSKNNCESCGTYIIASQDPNDLPAAVKLYEKSLVEILHEREVSIVDPLAGASVLTYLFQLGLSLRHREGGVA